MNQSNPMKIGSAISWNILLGLVMMVVQLASTMVMARLLTKEDYGVYAFGYAISVVVMHLAQRGLASAVLIDINVKKDIVACAVSASLIIMIGTAVVMILFWVGLLIYGVAPIKCNILLFSVLPLLLQIVASPSQAILQSEFRFRDLGLASMAGFLVGNVLVAPLCAWLGFGPWSLAFGTAVTSIASLAPLVWITRARLGLSADRDGVLRILRQMAAMNGLRALDVGWVQAPVIILSLRFSDQSVGLYSRTQFLCDLAMQLTVWRVSGVLYSWISNGDRDRQAMRQKARMAFGALSLLALPIATFLAFAAEPIIAIVLGQQWKSGVDCFRILAVTFCISTMNQAPGMFLEVSSQFRARYMVAGFVLALLVGLLFIIPGSSVAQMAWPAFLTAIIASSFAWLCVGGDTSYAVGVVTYGRAGVLLSIATAIGASAGYALANVLGFTTPIGLLVLLAIGSAVLSLASSFVILRLEEVGVLVDFLVTTFPRFAFLKQFERGRS